MAGATERAPSPKKATRRVARSSSRRVPTTASATVSSSRAIKALLGAARRVGDGGEPVAWALAAARALAPQRQAFVADDADDPGQRVARGIELAGALEQLAQRALRRVFGVGGVGHHARGDLAHARPGEIEDRAERRAVAVGEPAQAALQLAAFVTFHPVSASRAATGSWGSPGNAGSSDRPSRPRPPSPPSGRRRRAREPGTAEASSCAPPCP